MNADKTPLLDADGNELQPGEVYLCAAWHYAPVTYLGRASEFDPQGMGTRRALVRAGWAHESFNVSPRSLVLED